MIYELNGIWQADLGDGNKYSVRLPGTLDESHIGRRDRRKELVHPDSSPDETVSGQDPHSPIATRFTRKFTYEGEVVLSRRIEISVPLNQRVFLEAERARCLKLFIDGREVPYYMEASLSTPHIFEVTGFVNGVHEVRFLSDNSYPGLPRDSIMNSSAATDETQTNWNGIVGRFRLRTENPVFLSYIRVYPMKGTLTVKIGISAGHPYKGKLTVRSEALKSLVVSDISVEKGNTEVILDQLPISENIRKWDEYEGNLYQLRAELSGKDEKTVSFGVRSFGDYGNGRLSLNGRILFLRSEANCAVFPETGYPPMTVEEWTGILKLYRDYGINCMRFHSYCPPDAAFTAADRLGMLMQPELSHWNPKNAFLSKESYDYYKKELKQIILSLANHPSFVMLTLGNELWADETGHERMKSLVELARSLDSTRLYANGSNVHYGGRGCEGTGDFYASQKYYEQELRGTYAAEKVSEGSKVESGEAIAVQEKLTTSGTGIQGYTNNEYPSARHNYDEAMKHVRQTFAGPVFSFEVGQFEVLPDFEEIDSFHGISDPVNYRIIQEKVESLGLREVWKDYVEASGELSRIAYREEIEAAMRTKDLSGISLLGLQDFPGQGTALVGMMNAHLEPKPYPFARPEAFRSFFQDQLPLVLLEKYTYESKETLRADLQIANYGKRDILGCPVYELRGENVRIRGSLPEGCFHMGGLSYGGTLEISLGQVSSPIRLDLTVSVTDRTVASSLHKIVNTYPIWVYPAVDVVCPSSVYETQRLDDRAKEILNNGGNVYLTPPSTKEALPSSIKAQFTTDFWSVGTFPAQEGAMGQLIDADHAVFRYFPTETHTNWQWWAMATQRAVILPFPVKAIITEMDSYAYMRPMAQLFECRCLKGKLMFSSMGLQDLMVYPEARALQYSIYSYMSSDEFLPEQDISADLIGRLVP